MANNTLAVSNLDFVGIQQNLITFMQAYPGLKDMNYAGSNLRTLIDLLSYNSYLNQFYTNMALNESFLDTAQMRDSIVSHAKMLNYMPRSARSSQAFVNIQIFPTDNPSYITIPSGATFQGTNGNNIYTFMTNSAVTLAQSNGTYVVNNVSIYEGVNVTESFVVNTSVVNQQFVFSNPNIDTTSLFVQVPDANGNYSTWSYTKTLLNLNSTSNVYFLEATANNYKIVFGDGVSGAYPPNGGVFSATYRVCNLDAPNGITTFKSTQSLGGYSTYNVSTSVDANANAIPSSGGAGPESNSSIQFNAPRSYQTLDRAIVPDDYQNIVFENFPEVRDVYAYGGEEVTPPQYGKTFVAIDLTSASGLSQLEANKIQSFLSKSTMAIKPVVIAAEYIYVSVSVTAEYNQNVSDSSDTDIENAISQQIVQYNSDNLNYFNKIFRYSKLGTYIDAADSSLVTVQTNVSLFKNINPSVNVNYSTSLSFLNALIPGTIQSSTFTYSGLQCTLQDLNGTLNIVSQTGTKTSTITKIGTVDYTNGIINIINLNVSSFIGNQIQVYGKPTINDAVSGKNVILVIDPNFISVTATGVRA